MISTTIVELPSDVSKYNLVRGFLEFRKAVFIDQKSWSLPSYRGIEFEQYDTFESVYVIAHEDDEIMGGARLVRTDRTMGTGKHKYTYMIKDAYDGLLPEIPREICCEDPPVSDTVWELTRLASRPGVKVARDILQTANQYLAQIGAKSCLFLGPPAFLRLAKSMSFRPEPLGPIVSNPDGRFLAFSCRTMDVEPSLLDHRKNSVASAF